VCAENLIRFDLITESPDVGRDDRIPSVPAELTWLALQVKEPACGRELRLGFTVAQSTPSTWPSWVTGGAPSCATICRTSGTVARSIATIDRRALQLKIAFDVFIQRSASTIQAAAAMSWWLGTRIMAMEIEGTTFGSLFHEKGLQGTVAAHPQSVALTVSLANS
jgi:hypothetical protein